MTDRTPTDDLAAQPLTPLTRLHESRLTRWHQTGEALLTFENVRSWLNAAGLVLFAPLPQIAAPAPTLVEAVLGTPAPNPTLQQSEEARALLTRLVAEGIAVPLNLLGGASGAVGETPDYIASAAVFSYLFTLRGDKAWKQPPAATGVAKVSQLAAHAYEILAKSGPRTTADLTNDLGNAVTESAVLRALGELWTHLRVLPMTQQDGRATLWELASARYTKQIKAGANAGQPSALSALISLYLGQVAVATEEEIELFLSPLTSRSRTRDVLHALTAARQLETVAIEGRTMLHIAGEAPGFLNEEQAPRETIAVAPVGAEDTAGEGSGGEGEAEPGERIKKFVPKPRKIGTGPLAKGAPAKRAAKAFARPAGKSFGPGRGERPSFDRPARADRGGERTDRERRPFQKNRTDVAGSESKPRFDRPWEENRPKGAPREGRPSFSASAGEEGRRPVSRGRTERPERANGGWKPTFRQSDRPARGDVRQAGERPARRQDVGDAGRSRGAAFGDRPARFNKGPAKFGGAAAGAKRPFRRTEEGAGEGERPARSFRKFDARPAAKRPFAKREDQSGGERKPFRPRPEGGSAERSFGSGRPAKFAGKRSGPPRREGFSPRPAREGFSPRAAKEGFSPRPRREGFSPRPRGEGDSLKPRGGGFAGKPRGGGFAGKPRGEGFAGKPRGEGFAARPRAGRPEGGRPFVKKGASGTRPVRRTFKRKEDESA